MMEGFKEQGYGHVCAEGCVLLAFQTRGASTLCRRLCRAPRAAGQSSRSLVSYARGLWERLPVPCRLASIPVLTTAKTVSSSTAVNARFEHASDGQLIFWRRRLRPGEGRWGPPSMLTFQTGEPAPERNFPAVSCRPFVLRYERSPPAVSISSRAYIFGSVPSSESHLPSCDGEGRKSCFSSSSFFAYRLGWGHENEKRSLLKSCCRRVSPDRG